jgi:hypothetical protein
MAGVLTFLGATALVGLGAGAFTALLRLASPIDRVLAFATLALTQVTLTLIVAGGLIGRFDVGVVVGMNALVAAVAVGCARAAGVFAWHRPFARAAPARWVELARRHPWSATLALVAGAVVVWRAVLVILLPPYAYDGLSYHLTTVVQWIDAGRLDPNPLSLCCAHYPAGGELMFAWPLLLLGRDTLVDGVQLLFAVLGAVSVGGIARSVGVSSPGALAAAALFLLTPVVVAQSTANYVDVMVVATFLTALYFILRWIAEPRATVFLVLAGCATGFAAGVKATGVVLAAILFFLLVLQIVRLTARGRLEVLGAAVGLVAFVVPLLALGSFWYARNMLDFGNPVYPFKAEIAGVAVFDGTKDINDILTVPAGFEGESPWARVARSWWSDVRFWRRGPYTYESRLGGLGPLWPYLGLPLALVLAAAATRRRDGTLLAVIGVIALSVALLPYAWWSRFTMALAALGALAVVFFVEHSRSRAVRSTVVAATAVLVASGLWLSLESVDPGGRGRTLSLGQIGGLVGRGAEERTIGSLFFPEYRWVDAVPSGSAIGVELEAEAIRFVYPLVGSHHDRRVRALTANDSAGLADLVAKEGIDYIFVARGGRYDGWARSRRTRFARVEGGGAGAVVYRVLPR